jgi:hypothetical protein
MGTTLHRVTVAEIAIDGKSDESPFSGQAVTASKLT